MAVTSPAPICEGVSVPGESHVETGVVGDAVRTHYYAAGPAGAPVVILIHDGAWGADGWLSWGPVMTDLARDHRVYAPDLLGFGRSDKAVFLDRAPYAPRVRQISDFCRDLGITEPAHFVGTSFGGSVVLRGACHSGWPIASATSIGGSGGPWRLPAGIEALSTLEPGVDYIERVLSMLTNGRNAGLREHIDRRYANSLLPGHYACMVSPRLKHPEAPSRQPEDDYPQALTRATSPVAVVEMSDDQIIEAGWTTKLTAIAPNVTAYRMTGPHSPNLTQPAETVELLRSIFAAAGRG
jgi:pimeloyl-ACP methyl ester carboxylesterase